MASGYDASISYDASKSYDGTVAGFASYIVSVDWDNDGDFTDANSNVTDNVLSVQTSQGRALASQLTGNAVAGLCEITLKNNDGKYSSFNTSSALSGNILPNRAVKVEATSPSAEVLFYGYLESIVPSVDATGNNTATLLALGPLKRFATTNVSVPSATTVRTGASITAILDAVGWSASARTIATGKSTIPRFYAGNKNALALLREVEATEGGFIREGKDGKIIFEDRQHRYTATKCTTSQATFSDASGASMSYTDIVQRDPMDFIYNKFVSEVRTETVGSLATLWTHPFATTGGDAPKIEVGETVTIIAEYPNEYTADNQTSVNAWTTSAATTDYLTNTAQNGTGTNTTGSMTIANVKKSTTMEIKITNGHTADVYLTKLQARGTPVTASSIVKIMAEDSTSQTLYGLKEYPTGAEAKWIGTQEEANNWSRYHLSAFKDPTANISISVNANASVDTMTEALTLDVSDRVTVTASTRAKLGLSRDFYIETLKHTITAGGKHDVSMDLSDTEGYSGFWVLGTSRLGEGTRLAY